MKITKISIAVLSILTIDINSAIVTRAKEDLSSPIECVRPIPKPIVKKSVFPNTKFILKNVDRVPLGTETVKFNNGDKLVITNNGCENFSLDFQFETSRFAGNIKDIKYWYARSIQLMRQIEQGIDTASNIDKGIEAMVKYSKIDRPKIGRQIDYGGTEIRSIVQLVEVKKIGSKKFVITVNFLVGPL
jgi:hypothetical protein